jgi:catechol-2,3-dioxygenase
MSISKGTGFSVLGISHLLLQVSDLKAAENFYCNLLGLTVKSRSTFGTTRPLTVTTQGLGLTTLPQTDESDSFSKKQNMEHFALWITGMESLVVKLREEGYAVDGPKRNEYGFSMSVRDPDGNRVECIEND